MKRPSFGPKALKSLRPRPTILFLSFHFFSSFPQKVTNGFFLAVSRKKEEEEVEGDGSGEGRKTGRQATMHLAHGVPEDVTSGGEVIS